MNKVFLFFLMSNIFCFASENKNARDDLLKKIHTNDLSEIGKDFCALDPKIQNEILKEREFAFDRSRQDYASKECLRLEWIILELSKQLHKSNASDAKINVSSLYCCVKVKKQYLITLKSSDIKLIYDAQKQTLSKTKLEHFFSFDEKLQQELRNFYRLERSEYELDCNYRLSFNYRKKISLMRIIKKIFRLDYELYVPLSLCSMVAYTYFVTKAKWSGITGAQDPVLLAHNAQLQAKNAVIDELIKQGVVSAEVAAKHTIQEVPFNYSWHDYYRFIIPLLPSSFLTTFLDGLRIDDMARFFWNNTYYDNPPRYKKIEFRHIFIGQVILRILPHLFAHFYLTPHTLLPLSEIIFRDGTAFGLTCLAAILLSWRIGCAIRNTYQWKRKSIDFESDNNKSVADHIKYWLTKTDIEIQDNNES